MRLSTICSKAGITQIDCLQLNVSSPDHAGQRPLLQTPVILLLPPSAVRKEGNHG